MKSANTIQMIINLFLILIYIVAHKGLNQSQLSSIAKINKAALRYFLKK